MSVVDQQAEIAEVDRQIHDILEEQVKRARYEGLRDYLPYNKQHQFHSAKQPIRAMVGPNKCGKSWAGTADILLTIGKVHPWRPNHTGPVAARDCCVDFKTLHNTLIPIYEQMCPRSACLLPGKTFEGKSRKWPGLEGSSWDEAYNSTKCSLRLADGSTVEFRSYDQKPAAFGGPVIHIIRHDEEPPEFIFGENMARQLTVGTNMIFTLTPLQYHQWLWVLLCQSASDKVFTVQVEAKDNPLVTPEVVALMESLIANDAEREARIYGRWSFSKGRIFKAYGEHNFIEYKPIPRHLRRIVSIDPHLEKPTFVTWSAYDQTNKRIYFYREQKYYDEVKTICQKIKLDCSGDEISDWVIDPSARQKAMIRGQGSLLDVFLEELPNLVEADNHAKEIVRDSIMRLVKPQADGEPKLFVMTSCPMLNQQMLNYSWKAPLKSGEDRGKAKVLKKDEDGVDCVIQTIQLLDIEDDFGIVTNFETEVYGAPGFAAPNQFNFRHIGHH